MNRDYDYYEANAANINLEEITSSDWNKRTLQRLRDGNLNGRGITFNINGSCWDLVFSFREGDDLGWVEYFVGKSESLRLLNIERTYNGGDEGREQRIIHALSDGIARNQSIQHVGVLSSFSNDRFATIARALRNLNKLESLALNAPNDCATVRTLLESGVCSKLKELSLTNNIDIDDAGVAAFAHGLRNIGSSLRELNLSGNSIGSEGLSTLAAALANSTSLKILDLSYNNFSMAAAGLESLSVWLRRVALDKLRLRCCEICDIDDEGMQALAEEAINHCKDLHLQYNYITASGCRHLSNSLQSESCRLKNLHLGYNHISDDEAEILALGLVGNKTLRGLHFEEEDPLSFSPEVSAAFSKVLCNTSTVNDTYLSNHTIRKLWGHVEDNFDEDVDFYLRLNDDHPQFAARCKILINHNHLNMAPLLQWELRCLPLAVGWFERAKPCTTLRIYEEEESDEEYESRVLTALYEFVRGVPKKVLERRDQLILVAAYDDKIARLCEDVEQRDRKIAQLERDIKRLRVES